MRIDRLRLPAYRNLRNFEIDFDESQPTTILIGHNGLGKSNLLEAVIEIFRDLELENQPQFAYTLQYECRGHSIEIDADPDRSTRRIKISVDEESISQKNFQNKLDVYLPNNIFAYYSGWSSRMERCFDDPTRRYYREVLNSDQKEFPIRRMFFCRKEYSQLVLLAFFLAESQSSRNLLKQYLNIKNFDSALFVLKTPWWRGSGGPSKIQREKGDPRFWYARGSFKTFLSRLWDRALAPIRNQEAVERDIRRQSENTERLYLFIKNEDELGLLKESNEDSKTLFGYLESLFLCDLIDEVRVTVERTDGTRVRFSQLSEGEQQLLTVLGLLLFTQNDESLYLLDEPDTHLNPVWIYDYLKLLQEHIRVDKGQLIVATHDPLMIGSLHKNQVRSLSLEDNTIVAAEPEYDPMGIGIEGLLKSELYGLRSTLAPEILSKLDRHYELLGKKDKKEKEKLELSRLANELNELGVSRTHPNPYFEQFATAMAKRVSKPDFDFSREEIDEQAKLADEIIDEIISEEKSTKA